MHQKTKELQKRYEGFLQTNCLWESSTVYGLHPYKIESKLHKITLDINDKLRLGKYIERLVSFQLSLEKDISILCENIQIQQEKRTLGELDSIIKQKETIVHLEVVYKFYVYDATVGTTEIAHFIGPNRKDSLVDKLTKLKEKQLPLLYSKESVHFLDSINIPLKNIEQKVYFKAQLFMPLTEKVQLSILNKNCVAGFYIHQKELAQFSNCKFYIPLKKDWIISVHKNVNWLHFIDFKTTSQAYLSKEFSPLCWIKKSNGEIEKFFLVWW